VHRILRASLLIASFIIVAVHTGFAESRVPDPEIDKRPLPTDKVRTTHTPAPTNTPKPLPVSARVPILMYHYIADPAPNTDRIRRELSVSLADFEAQLKYLKDNGYTAISLYQLHDHLFKGNDLPPKPIVLTFDDGYLDHYTNAFPLLKKYGMSATFFVVTDYANYKNPEHLTWEMMREMFAAGMSIESHSRTHIDLRNRSNGLLAWELLGPVEQIEAFIGKRPRFFSYPTGRYDARVIQVLRDIQTYAAVTTEWGFSHTRSNTLTWSRIRIRNSTTIEGFANLVEQKD
jgi:peptidoglycan/xylan/chitin deacetylase (PgdA/CDA1 family)